MSDGSVAFAKWGGGGVLHIVLTAPPRLSYMHLADALVSYFGFIFTAVYN